jgi:hypothetical protein
MAGMPAVITDGMAAAAIGAITASRISRITEGLSDGKTAPFGAVSG